MAKSMDTGWDGVLGPFKQSIIRGISFNFPFNSS